MEKTGVNFLPRKTFLTATEKAVLKKFGVLKGYGFLNALENMIAAPGGCGYYMMLHKTTYASIAQELECDVAYVRTILRYLLDIGYYDLKLFKKFHILTNRSLQENVILAVYGKCRVHNYGPLNPNYIYRFIIAKMRKNANFAWFFEENPQFLKRQDNTRHINIITPNRETTTAAPSAAVSEKKLSQENANKIKKFKDAYPHIAIGAANLIIPDYVDMDLLIRKYADSPQFLQLAKNITLKWACQKRNYEKIIADAYTERTNFTVAMTAKPVKKESWEREYTSEELNSVFDSLEDIEIELEVTSGDTKT